MLYSRVQIYDLFYSHATTSVLFFCFFIILSAFCLLPESPKRIVDQLYHAKLSESIADTVVVNRGRHIDSGSLSRFERLNRRGRYLVGIEADECPVDVKKTAL